MSKFVKFVLFLGQMMRFLLSIFLPLLLLFWGKSHHLPTPPDNNRIAFVQPKPAELPQRASFANELKQRLLINTHVSTGVEKQNDKGNAAEIENEDDEDPVSVKKYQKITDCCITFFAAQAPAYFHQYTCPRLPFCQHFSETSSYRNAFLCVFRI